MMFEDGEEKEFWKAVYLLVIGQEQRRKPPEDWADTAVEGLRERGEGLREAARLRGEELKRDLGEVMR